MADFQNQKERLKRFISEMNLTNAAFEKSLGLSNGYINSMRKGLGYDKLELLSNTYVDLNIGWLLTGEGKMLNSEDNLIDGVVEDSDADLLVRQRINYLLNIKNESISSISEKIGINKLILERELNRNLPISAKTIISLLNHFTDLSAEWLLRGNGDVMKEINIGPKTMTSNTQKLLMEFNKQTEIMLKDRDDIIRDLQIEIALLKADKQIKTASRNII